MSAIEEIAEIAGRHAAQDGMQASALPRVSLVRSCKPTEPLHSLYRPSLCLVVQGRKQVSLGGRNYVYDPARTLVASVDLLVVGSVIDASPERPYLSVVYDLDLPVLAGLVLEHGIEPPPQPEAEGPGLRLADIEPPLVDAMARLLRLLDSPKDAPVLAPLAEREILYRLLTGEHAAMVRRLAAGESRLRQISRAIAFIRQNYARPFSIERLAEEAGMSPSAFHQHFKAVTAYSPLQYRTQLRLQEARRLMVAEGLEAASAGFRVGYESPSQFSRDYRRAFGAPPLRDAARLRAADGVAMVA